MLFSSVTECSCKWHVCWLPCTVGDCYSFGSVSLLSGADMKLYLGKETYGTNMHTHARTHTHAHTHTHTHTHTCTYNVCWTYSNSCRQRHMGRLTEWRVAVSLCVCSVWHWWHRVEVEMLSTGQEHGKKKKKKKKPLGIAHVCTIVIRKQVVYSGRLLSYRENTTNEAEKHDHSSQTLLE